MHEILSKQNKLKDFKSDSSTVAFKSFRAQMISVDNGCSHKKKGWKRWQSISSGHSKIGLGTCWPRPGQKHAGRAAGHRWSRGKLSDHFSSMYFPLCSKYQTNQRLEHSEFVSRVFSSNTRKRYDKDMFSWLLIFQFPCWPKLVKMKHPCHCPHRSRKC